MQGGSTSDIPILRKLCDQYGAFLHIDAAFGAFAALHPDFPELSASLTLADSIACDAHKWLNTTYDCGIWFGRSIELLRSVCGPGAGRSAPAYLSPLTGTPTPFTQDAKLKALQEQSASLQSPLFSGIENSRRFRALPLYCSLLSLGRAGYRDIFVRNIDFARAIVHYLKNSPDWTVLLPPKQKVMNICLFAPSANCANIKFRGPDGVANCVRAINVGTFRFKLCSALTLGM